MQVDGSRVQVATTEYLEEVAMVGIPLIVREGARSTALSTLLVALGTLLSALLIATYADADAWIKILIAFMVAADFIVFLAAYIFLMNKDRDALRSEPYALSKLAMEKSLTGDSLTGFKDKTSTAAQLPSPPPEGETE